MSWGVVPVMTKEMENTDELFEHAVNSAVKKGLLHDGDLVVITAGVPLGVSGTTNLLKVQIVGDALVIRPRNHPFDCLQQPLRLQKRRRRRQEFP